MPVGISVFFISSFLPILSPYLEVALWVVAYRADLRSLLANNDVTTVAALPYGVAIA